MCLFPWGARLDPEGGRPIPDREGELKLPCGKCDECLTLRSFGWATRARHEISLHPDNCFLTLSYSDENLPSHLILKDPFQRFMKRLRDKTKKKLSYMVSHEYGSQTFRPHHHAIIFGWSPNKWNYLKTTNSGSKIFTSPEISDLWRDNNNEIGYHSIGEANEKTAFYIASYALKGKTHTFQHEGEIITVNDSFDCSKRPAIGLRYLLENARQLVDSGEVLPRYYQKKLEQLFPDLHAQYQDNICSESRVRGIQQKLAKFTISNQKKSLGDSEYRSAPDNKEFLHKQLILKDEVKLYKENTHEETIHNPRCSS